jgi:hypothetical protein
MAGVKDAVFYNEAFCTKLTLSMHGVIGVKGGERQLETF